MLIIETLLKTLLITKVCLSLTIYQPTYSYLNYSGQQNDATVNLQRKHISHPQIIQKQGNGVKSKNKSLKTTTLSQITPHQASLYYKQPGYSNIYPVQYQFHNPLSAATRPTSVVANEQQPVTTASLESEILVLHASNKEAVTKLKPLSSVNYNNKIYHFKGHKRASPLANNEQERSTFIVRKQRNLSENHDDKLIEQNIKEKQDRIDVNDQPKTTSFTAAASSSSFPSIKQPSSIGPLSFSIPTTKSSSHEIRYLHDIFLNYPKPHHVNSGHIELSPVLFQKRFESQKAGNRYKGEVMWLDNTGGFAQHYWDLAQGKL